MTLLEIRILMHYHSFTNDYRSGDFTASAVSDAIDEFRGELGLLESISEKEHDGTMEELPMYRLTERGTIFVEALQKTPLPKQIWVMEDDKDLINIPEKRWIGVCLDDEGNSLPVEETFDSPEQTKAWFAQQKLHLIACVPFTEGQGL